VTAIGVGLEWHGGRLRGLWMWSTATGRPRPVASGTGQRCPLAVIVTAFSCSYV